MNAELRAVLSEMRSFAEKHGWTQITEAVDMLLAQPASATLLLASSGTVVPEAFEHWITKNFPQVGTACVELKTLLTDPLPAMKAAKAVALFECGELIDSGAAEAAARLWFNQERNSRIIVLWNAASIADEEQLDLVQRSVWRLLVPEPKGNWNKQDLEEYGVYLWDESGKDTFLRPRIDRDRDALEAWMRTAGATDDDLMSDQISHVVGSAEVLLAEERKTRENPSHQTDLRHLDRLRNDIADMKRRLGRRLQEDSDSILRQLKVMIESTEQEVLQKLKPQLSKRVRRFGSASDAVLKATVVELLQVEGERLERRATDATRAQTRNMLTGLQSLLQGVDWPAVNDVMGRGGEKEYPETLFNTTISPSNWEWPSADGRPRPDDYLFPPDLCTAPSSLRMPAAIIGAAALAATTYFLRMPPIGVFLAGGLGALGGGAIQRFVIGNTGEDASVISRARQFIQSVTHDYEERVLRLTMQQLDAFRDSLSKELKALEEALDKAVDDARKRERDVAGLNPDLAFLQRCRERVEGAAKPT